MPIECQRAYIETRHTKEEFVNDWLLCHKVALTNPLGMDDGPEIKFLTKILKFSMLRLSSSRTRVSDLNGLSLMLGRKRCGAKRSH